jgi:hypothetical protein
LIYLPVVPVVAVDVPLNPPNMGVAAGFAVNPNAVDGVLVAALVVVAVDVEGAPPKPKPPVVAGLLPNPPNPPNPVPVLPPVVADPNSGAVEVALVPVVVLVDDGAACEVAVLPRENPPDPPVAVVPNPPNALPPVVPVFFCPLGLLNENGIMTKWK